MKRIHWNTLVDGLALIAFVLLASTGLLLSYQLPPGSGGREMLGMGHGAGEKSVLFLWGLTRHEWGEIHYWLSLSIMAILAVHLFLHGKWILCLFKPSGTKEYSGMRLLLGGIGLFSLMALALVPYASSPIELERSTLQRDTIESESHDTHEADLGIRGRMTLAEISTASGVPTEYLFRALNIPEGTSPETQSGRLLRQVGKDMENLREAVRQYQQSEK